MKQRSLQNTKYLCLWLLNQCHCTALTWRTLPFLEAFKCLNYRHSLQYTTQVKWHKLIFHQPRKALTRLLKPRNKYICLKLSAGQGQEEQSKVNLSTIFVKSSSQNRCWRLRSDWMTRLRPCCCMHACAKHYAYSGFKLDAMVQWPRARVTLRTSCGSLISW